jgi:hypothetical protein
MRELWFDQLRDLVLGMDDGGVIAAAELLPDPRGSAS